MLQTIPSSVVRYADPVDTCVDELCGHGCIRVMKYIGILQEGRSFPEVAALTPEQRNKVLAELASIMAVYDGACDS